MLKKILTSKDIKRKSRLHKSACGERIDGRKVSSTCKSGVVNYMKFLKTEEVVSR